MYLSIVIPLYNEEKRIIPTVQKTLNYLKEQNFDFELIFVDDGSKDKTIDVLRGYENGENIKIIKHQINRGKGASVKSGVLASKGEIVLFSDADLSTPIEELDKLIKEIEEYDVVIGSRSIDENLLLKKQPIHRILIGKIAKLLIRLVLNINYKDTQCGFKLFKRDVAFKLFYKMRMKRWSFDYELLFLAKRFKFKVREVPVIWINNEDSRVNSFIDPIKSFIDLIKIRFNKY